MVLFRRDEGHWNAYRAVARGGLIALASLCLAAEKPPQQTSGHQGNTGAHNSQSGPAAVPKMEQAPTYVLNYDAPEESPKSEFGGIPPDGWVAIFTGVLTLATIGLGWATVIAANAAKKASDALPVLERAYVYPRLQKDSIGASIVDCIANKRNGAAAPYVTFTFMNFGKTPARLMSGEVGLHYLPPTGVVTTPDPWWVGYKDVLGDGEETDAIRRHVEAPLTYLQAQDIESGRCQILLVGWVNYLDIWGSVQTTNIAWKYNPALRCFVPEDGRGKEKGGATTHWRASLPKFFDPRSSQGRRVGPRDT